MFGIGWYLAWNLSRKVSQESDAITVDSFRRTMDLLFVSVLYSANSIVIEKATRIITHHDRSLYYNFLL